MTVQLKCHYLYSRQFTPQIPIQHKASIYRVWQVFQCGEPWVIHIQAHTKTQPFVNFLWWDSEQVLVNCADPEILEPK